MALNLQFGEKVNGTNVSGLMDVSLNPPRLFCYCSKANAEIIMKALQPPKKKTIEERAFEFKYKVWNHSNLYTEDILAPFVEYWTEFSDGAIKMRFEKEKAFDISKRLARWKANQKEKTQQAVIGRSTKENVMNNVKGWDV